MQLQAHYSITISAVSQGDPAWFTDSGDLFRQRLTQSLRKATNWTGSLTKFTCTEAGAWSLLVTVDRDASGISKTDASILVRKCVVEVVGKFKEEHLPEESTTATTTTTEETAPAEQAAPTEEAAPAEVTAETKTKTTRNSRKKAEQVA